MRRAFVLGGQRPDRGVELGALLLCAGDAEDDPALAAEGEQLLRRLGGGDLGAADGVRQRAAALLEQPSAACDDAP
jgi:hypothetical protein